MLLDHQFNAYVTQYQKVFFFGKKEKILVLGIPLLTELNRAQIKSILAHELAHVSNQDTRIGAWLYKVDASWGKLMYELENNDIDGTILFRTFIKWHYPRFHAYSHVLRRQEEYLADAFAAKVISVEDTSQALI